MTYQHSEAYDINASYLYYLQLKYVPICTRSTLNKPISLFYLLTLHFVLSFYYSDFKKQKKSRNTCSFLEKKTKYQLSTFVFKTKLLQEKI